MPNITKTTGKMTLTFNPKTYSELLSKHLPRVIKSEEENEFFLAIVEELMSRTELTSEEDTLLELLVALVEDFEDKHYQLNTSTPHSRLLHLMEARSLEIIDLVGIIDSTEVTARIVNGQQEISQKQAEALGEFFHVEPSLFILR